MDERRKELNEKIESGEFFAEARDWYFKTYLYNFIERSYLILLTIIIGCLLFYNFIYYETILPIKKSIPVQIRIQDPAEEYSRLFYLGNKEKNFNANHELIKFFTAKFVKALESYDHKNNFQQLRVNLSYIKNLSSEEVYSYYVDKVSLRSRNSIILKYKRNLVKKVNLDYQKIEVAEIKEENKVQEIFAEKTDIRTYVATVNFEIEEITKLETRKSNWQSKVTVEFENIQYDFDKKEYNDLNFRVTGYESKKL